MEVVVCKVWTEKQYWDDGHRILYVPCVRLNERRSKKV
jgi:hypothetical protein